MLAFQHSALDPSGDERNLIVGQEARVGKIAVALLRFPRRHVSRLRCARNQRCAGSSVRKRQQRKRRGALRLMTRHAVGTKDRFDIPAISRSSWYASGVARLGVYWLLMRECADDGQGRQQVGEMRFDGQAPDGTCPPGD